MWHEWLRNTADEQWLWLGSLNLYPRRRPVLPSTEEIEGIKEDEEIPECSEGESGRDLGLVDRPKEPKLTEQEKTGC